MIKLKSILTRKSFITALKIQPIKKYSFKILSSENNKFTSFKKICKMNFTHKTENSNKNSDSIINKEGKQELNKEEEQIIDSK